MNKVAVLQAIALVGKALARGSQMDAQAAFIKEFGDTMTFEWDSNCDECRKAEDRERCGSNFNAADGCGAGGAYTVSSSHIKIASLTGGYLNDKDRMTKNVVHELGHAYNNKSGKNPEFDMSSDLYNSRSRILRPDVSGRPDWQQNTTVNASETFADMFIAWTYNAWNTEPENKVEVRNAQVWMKKWVP